MWWTKDARGTAFAVLLLVVLCALSASCQSAAPPQGHPSPLDTAKGVRPLATAEEKRALVQAVYAAEDRIDALLRTPGRFRTKDDVYHYLQHGWSDQLADQYADRAIDWSRSRERLAFDAGWIRRRITLRDVPAETVRVITFTGDAAILEGVVSRGGGRRRLQYTLVYDRETDRWIVTQKSVIA